MNENKINRHIKHEDIIITLIIIIIITTASIINIIIYCPYLYVIKTSILTCLQIIL